ncbi:MAG: hypothetical protein LBQ74_05895 [Prevotella sp.]|nr:hypothetical protein [Prevotella sp.]
MSGRNTIKQRSYINMLVIGILIGGIVMYLFSVKDKGGDKVEVSHNMIVEKIESLGNLEVLKIQHSGYGGIQESAALVAKCQDSTHRIG